MAARKTGKKKKIVRKPTVKAPPTKKPFLLHFTQLQSGKCKFGSNIFVSIPTFPGLPVGHGTRARRITGFHVENEDKTTEYIELGRVPKKFPVTKRT